MNKLQSKIAWKEIYSIALPAIAAGIAEPVISLVDTAFVGQLGTLELGAVGIGSSFFTLIMWILAQTKSAISAIVSKNYGAKTLSSLQSFVPQALVLNFLLGAFVFLGTYFLQDLIFEAYNAQGDQKELIKSYFSIRGWGLPISLVVFGIFGVFRGLQNTYWAMQISLVGMFSNIILDYLLIFGFGEIIPAFGIEGAAWASAISQGIMLVLAIRFLLTKSKLKLDFTKTLHQGISKLLKMSFDLFLRAAALNVAFYFGTSFAASYGENQIAAYTIGINIWLFSSFFIDGFSNAGNAIGGRLAGEGNLNELKRVGYLLVKVNIGIALMLSLVYLIFYTYLGRFFTQEAEVLRLFEATFWIIIISQPINALAFTLDGIFKGLGHTALLRNVLIGAGVFAFLPAIFILDSFASNLFAIWFAFVFWMLARGLPLLFKFKNLKHV